MKIYSFLGQLIQTRICDNYSLVIGSDIWRLPIYVKTHISTKSFNIPVSIGLTRPAHIINGYDICDNKTNSDF